MYVVKIQVSTATSFFLLSETKRLAFTGKFQILYLFFSAALTQRNHGICWESRRNSRIILQGPPVPNPLFLPMVCAQSSYCILSLSFGSITLHSALGPSLFPETRALQWEPQPHLGMRSAQAPSLTLHLLPGPGVSAAAANRSTEQLHRRLLLDATRSGKGSEIKGSKAVSSCSTKISQRAQGHMLCSLHV